ncbi:MAG: hypothetical protein BWX66_00804 [Deltaproteobacteria bacterium ADurb.Bin058]|nr:MAG: hypothetical protein BWX66_00804 [Deltaproteobacteria bacterium ADurb.Bin058]
MVNFPGRLGASRRTICWLRVTVPLTIEMELPLERPTTSKSGISGPLVSSNLPSKTMVKVTASFSLIRLRSTVASTDWANAVLEHAPTDKTPTTRAMAFTKIETFLAFQAIFTNPYQVRDLGKATDWPPPGLRDSRCCCQLHQAVLSSSLSQHPVVVLAGHLGFGHHHRRPY